VGLQATFRKLKSEGKLPVKRESFIYINSTNAGEVYVNSIRLTDTDATDIIDLSNAEVEGILQVPQLVKLLKESIPGFENCFVSAISSSIGVRETRRIKGIKRLYIHEIASSFEDELNIFPSFQSVHHLNNCKYPLL
jgi:hypothetical protein